MDKIQERAREYYNLICSDYHKDRDCHFEIVAKWSYGKFVGWEPRHPGYLHKVESNVFGSFKEAAGFLIERIEEMIAAEKNADDVGLKTVKKEEAN
ncbi:MAG: hypothetical protein D6732_00390 [Methanobacteriota archaeon]|nr:MAG: hypothetical protein D6732_00390 [Euryarchaeota archaeon]